MDIRKYFKKDAIKSYPKRIANYLVLDDIRTVATALYGKADKEGLKASLRLGIKALGAAALHEASGVYANWGDAREFLFDHHLYLPGLSLHDLQQYEISLGFAPGAATAAYSIIAFTLLGGVALGTYATNHTRTKERLGPGDLWESVKACPISVISFGTGLAGYMGLTKYLASNASKAAVNATQAANASTTAVGNATGTPAAISNATCTPTAVGTATPAPTATINITGTPTIGNVTPTPTGVIGNATNESVNISKIFGINITTKGLAAAAVGAIAVPKNSAHRIGSGLQNIYSGICKKMGSGVRDAFRFGGHRHKENNTYESTPPTTHENACYPPSEVAAYNEKAGKSRLGGHDNLYRKIEQKPMPVDKIYRNLFNTQSDIKRPTRPKSPLKVRPEIERVPVDTSYKNLFENDRKTSKAPDSASYLWQKPENLTKQLDSMGFFR
ncbi:Uncharacterised protein [uncultured archaeon]|nr:Uncharacterised protein [uncultured archaeon]